MMQSSWCGSLSRVGFVAVSVLLIGLSLPMVLPGQANAVPTLFTDRAAFDAAVGSYISLTLDTPSQTTADGVAFTATYNQLMLFKFDQLGGVGVGGLSTIGGIEADPSINPPGTVTLGQGQFGADGLVLQPVTAFGFDVTSPLNGTLSFADIFAGSDHFHVPLTGVNFLGVVSTSPFEASVQYVPFPINLPPLGNVLPARFTIDNVAIKTVPEPSSLLFLGIALMGFIGWHSLSRKFGQA